MTKAELLKKLETVADDEEVSFEEPPQPADPTPDPQPADPIPADKPIQMTVSDLMRLIEAEREKSAKILAEKEKENKPVQQEGDDNAEIFIL